MVQTKKQSKTKKTPEEIRAQRIKNLRPCGPGQTNNRKGRPPLPDFIKKAPRINQTYLKHSIAEHFDLSLGELTEVIENPETRVLDLIIAKTMVRCQMSGEIDKAEYLFRRAFGAVQESVKIDNKKLANMTPLEKLKAAKDAIKFIEDTMAANLQAVGEVKINSLDVFPEDEEPLPIEVKINERHSGSNGEEIP